MNRRAKREICRFQFYKPLHRRNISSPEGRHMLKATFSRYLFNKGKQRGRGQRDCTITKKIGMGEGGRACSIYPARGVGCRGLCVTETRRKKKTMIRVCMLEWLPRNESYRLLCRDSEEKFFSLLFLWRPFILFAGHESLGMQDQGLGNF